MIKLKEILNNKIYGIYHKADLDGICSGTILKYKYPSIILVPFNYGQSMPNIDEGSKVIMVDVSMKMKDMKEISKITGGNFIWIDHHYSSYKEYKAFESFPIEVIYDEKIAACEGVWKYLFPNTDVPLAVKLLGMYDTWRNKDEDYWNNVIVPFQYGMRGYSINKFPMQLFKDDTLIDKIMEKGNEIVFKVDEDNKRILKNMFPMQFLGYSVLCVQLFPGDRFQSNLFLSIYDKYNPDATIAFGKTKTGIWKFHLRSKKPNMDCSKLAKWLDPENGGGHKLAAGADVTDINKFVKLIPTKYLNKIKID